MNLPDPATLVRTHYDLDVAAIRPLAGEVDYNFRVTDVAGHDYVCKLSPAATQEVEIAFQAALLEHLARQELPFAVPRIVPTTGGAAYLRHGDHFLRLQHWVPGRPLGTVCPVTPELLRNWGATAGHLSRALADFDHPYAHQLRKWDPSHTLSSRPLQEHMTADQRALTDHFWDRFERHCPPILPTLRQSVNYNDAHEQNLLVTEGRISGVIDVGDAVFTHTINELAIACAYAGMERPDPLGAMAEVVRGYHAVFAVTPRELEVLYELICARLLITVATAAHNAVVAPENDYLQVSARPAWALLAQLRPYAPGLARAHFRVACGLPAHPDRAAFDALSPTRFRPVMDLSGGAVVPMDLSVGSLDLGHYLNYTELPRFTVHLRRWLEDAGATFGVGGYGETRPVYTKDAYRTEGNGGPRWRTVHLGLDVWTRAAGEIVYAPLDGTVHSLAYDPAPGSYGNTLLLEHRLPELTFYTLYGHLSHASLLDLAAGTQVRGGQAIATLGDPEENGGWPPHLHFQVLLDPLGYRGDFPGVAFPEEAAVWLGLCPDPRSLFPHPLPAETGTALATGLAERRQRALGYGLSLSYRRPLHIVRGVAQYLLDASGRRFLDTVNNVAHVGHEHPAVVEAARRQMAVLNTNSRYLHENVVAFAEELAATLPDPLSVVHFVNSGSEANELALRMAEAVTGNRETVALEVGYHGNTGRTIDVSSYKFDGKGGRGCPPGTHLLPLPDQLRGSGLSPGSALEEILADGRPRAFLAESILSCGGQIVLPEGYLSGIYRRIRAGGGLCIADEVQVGIGRVGSHFWGFELQGVVPDIVTVGKPLGNGHPLGAVVCTPAVAAAFANGMEYFNTFGGNPVSCAVGRAVLATVRHEGLQARALELGNHLQQVLRELAGKYPLIADVRGHGLFLGFELAQHRPADGTTAGGDASVHLAPAPAPAAYLKNRMRELGFLMSTDGPHENVIKIKPPLCIDRANVDELLYYLDRALGEDGCRPT